MLSLIVNGETLIDFSNPQTQVFDFGSSMGPMLNYTGLARKSNAAPGIAALWGGNINADHSIRFDPPGDDHNIMLIETFVFSNPGNFSNGAIGYFQGDFDLNSRVKYVNPNDDKNMLFAQVLFYPLNSSLLSNFSYFIEQVPKRNP